ncbi:Flp1 family type IVb pilin [Paenibacillus sp. KN14-4R]|uniref:Flp1 family type IVb pilin n=1 Tax=Paenibacillus sp. KN14-4R TaxID=3445773 RepID=UPI003F9FD935
MKKLVKGLKRFWNNEDGLGTLEILLIVAVLVAIAIIFRKWIAAWFNDLIGKADKNLNDSGTPTCQPVKGVTC